MMTKLFLKFSAIQHRGFHDSTEHFPVDQQKCQYHTQSSQEITLDFGTHQFTLPIMFMHYIDDIKAVGWSWDPPKELIDCLHRGYAAPKSGSLKEITNQKIGFLVRHNEKIYDTHGGDQNITRGLATEVKVETTTVSVDSHTLEILKQISAFAYTNPHRLDEPPVIFHYDNYVNTLAPHSIKARPKSPPARPWGVNAAMLAGVVIVMGALIGYSFALSLPLTLGLTLSLLGLGFLGLGVHYLFKGNSKKNQTVTLVHATKPSESKKAEVNGKDNKPTPVLTYAYQSHPSAQPPLPTAANEHTVTHPSQFKKR